MTRGKRREARKRTVPIKGSRTKATNGIDLNGNTGSFAGEEFGSDFEEEFIIPSRVFSAYAINAGTEFSSGIERNDGVRMHLTEISRWWLEILGRDQVNLENLGFFHVGVILFLD